jgi:PTH1 family peptidyl-tRNA hydrolase
MRLWVGLGNPEPGMARQRHNIGFMAVDAMARRYAFSPWRARFRGLTAEGSIGGEKVLALKPLTYMNASGESVQAAAAFFKIPLEDIWIFHDELDLAPGKLRVKKGGGAAGHNGLRSCDQQLGSPDYWRVRLGIGHPGSKERVLGYVLGDFAKSETEWLADWLAAIADNAPALAAGKPEGFMTAVAAGEWDKKHGV